MENNLDFLNRVGAVYLETESVKKTAEACQISEVKVRRILITLGLWSSPACIRVTNLEKEGYSVSEIADQLSISVSAVEAYMPYRRGAYGVDQKSADAIRSDLYRNRQKQVAENMRKMRAAESADREDEERTIGDVNSDCEDAKNDWGQIRKQWISEEKKKFSLSDYLMLRDWYNMDPLVLASASENWDEQTVGNNVFHLKLELMESDQLSPDEKELARVEHSISREVLLPGTMNLRAFHYVIQRLFGWQNSHLHNFQLTDQDFDRVTAGRLGCYTDLCGVLFRFPDDAFSDKYWDSDYEEGVSVKAWLKRKYHKPFVQKSIGDTLLDNERKVSEFYDQYDFVEESFLVDVNEKVWLDQKFNYLLESLRVKDVFSADLSRELPVWKAVVMQERNRVLDSFSEKRKKDLRKAIQQLAEWRECLDGWEQGKWMNVEDSEKQAQSKWHKSLDDVLAECKYMVHYWERKVSAMFKTEYLCMKPLFQSLLYEYDYGDGWQVQISLLDVYCSEDTADLSDDFVEKIQTVAKKEVPVCLAADGLPVLDDCGGVGGFAHMLRIIHGDDEEERQHMSAWARGQGWTGRRETTEKML